MSGPYRPFSLKPVSSKAAINHSKFRNMQVEQLAEVSDYRNLLLADFDSFFKLVGTNCPHVVALPMHTEKIAVNRSVKGRTETVFAPFIQRVAPIDLSQSPIRSFPPDKNCLNIIYLKASEVPQGQPWRIEDFYKPLPLAMPTMTVNENAPQLKIPEIRQLSFPSFPPPNPLEPFNAIFLKLYQAIKWCRERVVGIRVLRLVPGSSYAIPTTVNEKGFLAILNMSRYGSIYANCDKESKMCNNERWTNLELGMPIYVMNQHHLETGIIMLIYLTPK